MYLHPRQTLFYSCIKSANDVRQGLVALVQVANYLLLVVLFSVWVYRANNNAQELDARTMRFTPGWCVGWFFVPIMNIFKPYQAVKEIWKASHPDFPRRWQDAPVSPLVELWWIFWIGSGFLGQASFRLSMRAEELDELLMASWVTMIADVINIPLTILAILVVRGINDMQDRKHATGPAEPPTPPALTLPPDRRPI